MPSANISRFGQQADDEERFVRKVEEESRVHEHAVALEQIDDQVFFASRRWDPQDGRPSSVSVQHLDRRMS